MAGVRYIKGMVEGQLSFDITDGHTLSLPFRKGTVSVSRRRKLPRARHDVLFVDMDGVLLTYPSANTEESWDDPETYISQKPQWKIVNAVKEFYAKGRKVYVVSTCHNRMTEDVKHRQIDRLLPFVDREHRFILPYGTNKAEAVKEKLGLKKLNEKYVLIDDHSRNLIQWQEAGGRGIKCLNPDNGTNGSWKGAVISSDSGTCLEKRGLRVFHDGGVNELVYRIMETAADDYLQAKNGRKAYGDLTPDEVVDDVMYFFENTAETYYHYDPERTIRDLRSCTRCSLKASV